MRVKVKAWARVHVAVAAASVQAADVAGAVSARAAQAEMVQVEADAGAEKNMLRIIFAARNYAGFAALVERLREEPEIELIPVSTAVSVKETLTEQEIHLIIAAEELEDCSGADCIRRVAMQFPLVHTALCSPLDEEAFHEATEGLGVLLQLPPRPGRADAERILERMAHIASLLQCAAPSRMNNK